MKEMNANELERAEKIMEKVVDAFQGELGDKPKVNFVMHTLELIVGYFITEGCSKDNFNNIVDLFCDNVKNIIHLWNKNENQYKQEEAEKEDQEDQKEEEEYGEDENEVEIKHTTCASLAIYLMDELSKRLKEKAREENIELDGDTWNNLRGTTLAHIVALFFLDIFYEHDDCCKLMELENFFKVVSRIMKSSIYIKKNIGHENNEDN